MVNLFEKAQKKKNIVLFSALSLSVLFAIEVYFISTQQETKILPAVILALGFVGLVGLQVSYFLSRKFLVNSVVKNLVDKKSQRIDEKVLSGLLTKDFSAYLRSAHVFIPRDFNNRNELDRVEGLSSFINKYQTYADLNLLESFSEEILDKNKTLKFSYKELSIDFTLFAVPFLVVFLQVLQEPMVLAGIVSILRVFTCAYYFNHYVSSKKEKFSLKKLEHFLFGDFEFQENSASRVELGVLKASEANSILFLVDSHRRAELEKLVRYQTSGNRDYKDWSVISAENSVYKNKVKKNKAFILYPSEMLFPYEEMQEFIDAFDEVIILDSSPSYALSKTAVFYLDHDQKIKEVHLEKNAERLSGDKGLILRNFKANNFDLFLSQVEKRIISKKPLYLVYGDAQGEISCEKNFVYPSGIKMVSIVSKIEAAEKGFYCDLRDGGHQEKLQRAKTFVANCSYHKIYSDVVKQKKLKDLFRAS